MRRIINILLTANARTSAIFYFGRFFLSVGNYLFHLLLLRLLVPEAYGEFLSYISFLYLITIPAGAVVTLVTKYVADFYGQQDEKKINYFFYLICQKIVLPAVVLGLIVILSSKWLAPQLKAQPLAFVILGVHIMVTFFGAVIQSYLLALQQFIYHVLMGMLDVIFKVLFTYLLIINGWGAVSGVLGLFLAGLVSLALILFKIKSHIYPRLKVKEKIVIQLGSYTFYALILSAGSLSLMSSDVLLVRYFFDPQTSGWYSALSILGRMINFGLVPLSALLLPFVAKRYAAGQNTSSVLMKLGLVTVGLGLVGVLIFTLMPELIISILSGSQYLAIKPWLSLFSVGMLCFAISQLLLAYFMSVGHQRATLIMLVATVLQPLIIGLRHASLNQVVVNNLLIQIGLLFSLFVYYRMAVVMKK